jgi:hypothetical protein
MRALTGRRLQIASGLSGLPDNRVYEYRQKWQSQGYELPDWSPAIRTAERISTKTPGVGDIIEEAIAWLIHLKAGSGCKCKQYKDELNTLGPDGCETHLEAIVDRLTDPEHRKQLAEHLHISERVIGSMIGVRLMRIGARRIVQHAIKKCRRLSHAKAAQIKAARTLPRKHGKAGRYTGWRGMADDVPKLMLGPFKSTVRHLTYHVWPTTMSDSWQWNLEQLSRRWNLFNGLKILSIVTDDKTVTAEQVVEQSTSLGMTFDHVIKKPNVPKLREYVTWRPMLELLSPGSADSNEVVFSAHAKGAQYDDGNYTRNWTQLMYRSCLDYWPLVEEQLSQSLMTGSFREFGLLRKWNNWAYSGTFYWWRLAELGKRQWYDIDRWFAATESWPGKMCEPRETDCLFLNNNTRLYVPEYWTETVWPEWTKWKDKHEAYYARHGSSIR